MQGQQLSLSEGVQAFRENLATVDDDRLAGDVAGLFRREEQGGIADILDRPELLQRNRSRHRALVFRPERDQSFGQHIAGQHGVDGNAVFGELDAGRAHAALPRKATSTFSGTAPSEVNSVSMA